MKKRLWIKIVGALGVLSVAGVVTVVTVLKSIDFNDFKSDIEVMVKDATGRDLRILGALDLVVSLSPSLNVSNVTLGNADWGVDKPMVVLKNLKAKVDLVSLLTGQVNVDYFVIDGLSLIFQTDGKGRANWEFSPSTPAQAQGQSENQTQGQMMSDGLTIIPMVQDVRLRNVDVTYIDGASGRRLHTKLARVDMQAKSYTSPMKTIIQAVYNGVNIDVQGELGSMEHLIGTKGGAFPVNLTIDGPDFTVSVVGGVEQPSQGMAVEARVTVMATKMNALSRLTGADLSPLQRLDARMTVTGSGANYKVSALDIKTGGGTGGSDLGGTLQFDVSKSRPRVTGKLKSKVLDIDQMLGNGGSPQKSIAKSQTSNASGEGATQAATSPKPQQFVFNDTPISFEALQKVEADIVVQAQRITVQTLAMTNVQARLKIENGRLNVAPFRLKVGRGDVSGRIKLSTTGKTPKLSFKSTLKNVDSGDVLAVVGLKGLVSLVLNGKLDIATQGSSTRSFAQGLTGMIELSGKNGKINDETLKGLTGGLGNVLPWGGHGDANIIRCFVARLPLKKGTAFAKTVLVDTPGFNVQVTGNIDLGGERFHLTAVPEAKTTSLASFAVPVRIKGPLSAPYIGVDAGEAVVGTVGNIVKAPVGILADVLGIRGTKKTNAPCFNVLNGEQKMPKSKLVPPAKSSNPKKKSKRVSKTPGEAVNDLGNALKGLFGQ